MKILHLTWHKNKLSKCPPSGLAVTFGCFDAIHLGHQKALSLLKREASKRKLQTALCLFHPHPQSILRPLGFQRLFPLEEIQEAALSQGLDFFLIIPFNRQLSSWTAKRFISSFIIKQLRPKLIVAGSNFSFGAKRQGNVALLKSMAEPYEALSAPLLLEKSGEAVSTSKIKALLSEGKLQEAALLLGRPFTFSGRTLSGRKQARNLGFPTANISFKGRFAPRLGVYSAKAFLDGKSYPAVVNIGFRPTFQNSLSKASRAGKEEAPSPQADFTALNTPPRASSFPPLAEVHILKECEDFYGGRLKVQLFRFLRDERAFPSVSALRRQIQKDVQLVLASPPAAFADLKLRKSGGKNLLSGRLKTV